MIWFHWKLESKIKYDISDNSFPHKWVLSEHMIWFHVNLGRKLKCDVCDDSFPN